MNTESFPAKSLRDKTDVTINGRRYFVSSIPAIPAQRMLLKAFSALSQGGIGALPPDVLSELLSYAGTYNQHGQEVQFANDDLVELMGVSLADLIELETVMLEKNLGFFTDGSLSRAVERLTSIFAKGAQAAASEART